MTDKQYSFCVNEAKNYTDRDAYVSDLALSSMWGDAEDDEIPQERIEFLSQLWDACHRSVKDIAAAAGLSQRKLAERFCIPYRTVECWCGSRTSPSARSCPLYTRLMMQECLGLLHR